MSKQALQKILAKLQKLDEYIVPLLEIQRVNKTSFINDYHFYGLAERFLQTSIEVLLDVAKLLLVYKDLPKPDNNQDCFRILFVHKILSKRVYDQLAGISG